MVLSNILCDLYSPFDTYLMGLKHCLILIVFSTEGTSKSPSLGLGSLPDSGPSGPAYIHVDEPEESIINQLLRVYYCLHSPATLVLLNLQNNPVI